MERVEARWLVAAAALYVGGCDLVFGPDLEHALDAPIEPNLDAPLADARVDGSALVDSDGDGAFDDTDNCVTVSNADQADEDSDDFGDACDNCPETSNPNQADDSEAANSQVPDGIGDACDPDPCLGGDTRVLFEPFNDETHLETWGADGGIPWVVTGDGRVHPSEASGPRGLVAPNVLDPLTKWNRAATRFIDLGSPTDGHVAGVVIHGGATDAEHGLRCQTRRQTVDSLDQLFSNGIAQAGTTTLAPVEGVVVMSISAMRTGTTLPSVCRISGQVPVPATVNSSQFPIGDRPALFVEQRDVAFEYLVVYSRTTPPTGCPPP